MKLRYLAPLAIAASAAAIGLAPIAAADATVQQSPGNAQITATPGAAAQEAAQNQQPFGGDSGALLSTTADNDRALRASRPVSRGSPCHGGVTLGANSES
ncbi:MAG: hypothetical protein QOC76_1553 [Mycobacterium sp.]|jgi:hypothetical protein|nr:hypothetical protein [Mycobacterium sp.]